MTVDAGPCIAAYLFLQVAEIKFADTGDFRGGGQALFDFQITILFQRTHAIAPGNTGNFGSVLMTVDGGA